MFVFVIEMKSRNPSFGYGRISMQIFEAFSISISRFAVGRILRKNKHNLPSGDGPSWLTSLGHFKDSLWSRGAVHAGDCDGVAYCRMFNEIKNVHPTPKYLSSDNDPLFLFHRSKSNLRVLEISALKSVSG
ncbi:MAG: hypothetical protein ACJAVI_004817 [Candidatus Azotimanducaceae bacterium]|jgi:hypothetical protein